MKKLMKRIGAVLMAVAMMAALGVSAWATSPTGGQTVDESISITGLQKDDSVNFYKVLEWNNGWKAAAGFTDLTSAQIEAILGKAAEGSNPAVPAAITVELADEIAVMAKTASVKYANVKADNAGKAEQSGPEAGLYVGIITPKNSGYTYNPVFVGADYTRNSTNTQAVGTDIGYSNAGKAKKVTLDLEKTATVSPKTSNEQEGSGTVAVGDKITFTVTTAIPGFSADYTAPVFKVTDKLSKGLELDLDSVTVTAPTGLTKDTQYTVTDKSVTASDGFELAFSATYLKTVTTATPVTITYDATVTNAAEKNVNQDDNTVTLNYSNSPSDTEGHGSLRDKTNHYTFDIDADLFGETEYENTEVVKVGIDKNGNEITANTTLDNGKSVGALQGAKFTLYQYTGEGDWDGTLPNENATVYSNGTGADYSKIVSDAEGRLTIENASVDGIRGLDAGTYYLVETEAPAGYIKSEGAVKIEIEATIVDVEVTDADGYTYTTNELTDYSVKIGGVKTAKYTMTNNAQSKQITTVNEGDKQGDKIVGEDADSGKIKNKQGQELPSTGGIGTYVFTVAGVAIMAIAAGLLIVRHKKKA